MLKLVLATFALIGMNPMAHANDSAFAKIRVRAIQPGSLKEGHDVKFYGKNADDFFKMLPTIAFAGTPEEQAKLGAKQRHLAIESGKSSINISCSKSHYDEKSGNEVKNANGTECRISISAPDREGDSYDYSPKTCN